MKKLLPNQRGAMVLEIIIGAVLIAVTAAVIYTVVQIKQKDNQPVAEPAPKAEKQEPKFLEIKEISLKLPILPGLEDVTYKSYPEETSESEDGKKYQATVVAFSSKSVVEAAKGTEYSEGVPANCTEGSIGAISKYSMDAATLRLPYSAAQRTIKGKYYDISYADGGGCTNDPVAQKIIQKQMELLKQSFASAESL